MVLLAFFPSELLSLICGFVDPEDFASFSVLNRRFHAIAEPFRDHHREQWSKYAILQDRENTSPWFWHNVLRSVLEGWEEAKYVRTLRVSYSGDIPGRRFSHDQNQLIHDWDFKHYREVLRPKDRLSWQNLQRRFPVVRLPREHCRLISESLKEELWFAYHGLDQDMDEIQKKPFILALLASRLPNLRTLRIARCSSTKLYHLQNAVWGASIRLSVPEAQCGPFSRLREVDFTTGEGGDYEHLDYVHGAPGDFEHSFLLPFLALPSIRSLKTARVIGLISYQEKKLPPSKLANLSIRKLDIPPNAVSAILEMSPMLRNCELTGTTTSSNFSVPAAIEALLANASSTLERLTLHAELHNTTTGGPVSFASFNSLKFLDISYDCLCLSSLPATRVGTLSNILPARLETLKIHAPQFRERLALDILGLLTESPPKQPKLKYLFIKSWIEDKDRGAMQQACQIRDIRYEGDLAIEVVEQLGGNISTELAVRPVNLSRARTPAIRPGLSLHTHSAPESSG